MLVVYLNPLRKAIMTRVWGLRASGCWFSVEASVPGRLDGQEARPPFSGKQTPDFRATALAKVGAWTSLI